jgi:hypothetical protein
MTMTAEILSPWAGDGSELTPNAPQLGTDHAIDSFSDVTGTPSANLHPDPSFVQVKAVSDDLVMAAIEADTTYVVVIGPTDVPVDPEAPVIVVVGARTSNIIPDPAAFAAFRAECDVAGFTVPQLDAMYGTIVDGRDWETISEGGIQYLHDAPKG